jgi:predicted outer membrane repeat protein
MRRFSCSTLVFLLLFAAFAASPQRVTAATFNVSNLNDSGAGSLRQALIDAAASPGSDTITFGVTGTILLDTTLIIDSDVTIDGPGADLLTISGQYQVRVITVDFGVTATIQDVTIADGHVEGAEGSGGANSGAGISNLGMLTVIDAVISGNDATSPGILNEVGGGIASGNGGICSLTVIRTSFLNNAGGYGGGIFNEDATLVIQDSTFSSNTTATNGDGGAIYTGGGSVTITNTTFQNNHGRSAGGIASHSDVSIDGSAFSGNTSFGLGGAVYHCTGAMTITNSTFENNSANWGGAIEKDGCEDGTLAITGSGFFNNFSYNAGGAIDGGGSGLFSVSGSSFSNNSSMGWGGAIAYFNVGTITNSTFANNSAGEEGGAIATYGGLSNLTVTDSTFTGNTAATDGGGIYAFYAHLAVDNSIFNNNTAQNRGGGILTGRNPDEPQHGIASVTHSVFNDNSAGWGGGIWNSGDTMVAETSFSANSALNGTPGETSGGGIFNDGGSMNITRSTFSGNVTSTGGGIYHWHGGFVSVSSSTFYGNNVGIGGGIFSESPLFVSSSTFSDNSAALYGGGIVNNAADAVSVDNSIFSNSTCSGIMAGSHNVATPGSGCSGIAEYDDLMLGTLSYNGGLTQTIPLLLNSPAINMGDNALIYDGFGNYLTTDQRGEGYPRILNGTVDVGAFESAFTQPPGVPNLITPSGTQTTQPVSFSFNAVPNAGWYYLWVTGDGGHVLDQWYAAVEICDISVCTVTPPISYSPQNYQWWVQAWGDSFGYTEWSSPLTFLFGTPDTPTPLAPIGVLNDPWPTFQWTDEPGLTWYNLWIADPNGGGQEFWFEDWQVCDGTMCSAAPLDVGSMDIYQWWVRGWVNGQYTDWSAGQYFQLPLSTAVPSAPVGTITTSQPTFTWNHTPSAYWFYLWLTNDATGYVLDQWYNAYDVCIDGTCSVTPPLNLPDGNYTFWVQAWSPVAGYGLWSAGTQFTVSAGP